MPNNNEENSSNKEKTDSENNKTNTTTIALSNQELTNLLLGLSNKFDTLIQSQEFSSTSVTISIQRF